MKTKFWGKYLPKNVWLFVYGMTTADWAVPPLDAGTERVIRDGMVVLFEQGNLLSQHERG